MVTEIQISKHDYEVHSIENKKDARGMIATYHYSKGSSKTEVYLHGLYRKTDAALVGVAQWLPPTGPAAKSVNLTQWKRVLSLSRLVVIPGTPKNAAGFLLARSIRKIKRDGRFVSLVTYACESQGHTGIVYQATNWIFVGQTGKTVRWVDTEGKQVATKSTVSRTKMEMLALGYTETGRFRKAKYVLHLDRGLESAVLRLNAALSGLDWTMKHG